MVNTARLMQLADHVLRIGSWGWGPSVCYLGHYRELTGCQHGYMNMLG